MFGDLASALSRAVEQLPERSLRGPLVATLVWTVLAFVLLWSAVIGAVERAAAGFGEYGWLAGIAVALLLAGATWLLFAAVANTIMLLYSDRIVAAVEARHYPALLPAGAASWRDALQSALRLLLWTVLGNLLALPLYLFFPGMNLVLFLGLNGYVLGRGYFDAVTLRRMDGRAARLVWRAQWVTYVVNGALAAFLLTVPVLNLIVPIVGLAATVHLVEGRSGARLASGNHFRD